MPFKLKQPVIQTPRTLNTKMASPAIVSAGGPIFFVSYLVPPISSVFVNISSAGFVWNAGIQSQVLGHTSCQPMKYYMSSLVTPLSS